MVYLFLAAGTLVFVVCFKLLDVIPHVSAVVATVRQAHGIIRSRGLTDEAKEVAIQKTAVSMAALLTLIIARMALCLLVPVAALWLGAQSGAYSMAEALTAASDWTFITASSAVMLAALTVLR